LFHHFRRGKTDLAWLNREVDVEKQPDEPAELPGDTWLVAHWLDRAVAKDERDQQTYEMIRYKARTGKTDEQVAADHFMTYAAWTCRLSRFRTKYAPRWRRRQLFVILMLGGGAAVVVFLAWHWWKAMQPDIGPDRPFPTPSARPSASAPPVPTDEPPFEPPFEPSYPTPPRRFPDQK